MQLTDLPRDPYCRFQDIRKGLARHATRASRTVAVRDDLRGHMLAILEELDRQDTVDGRNQPKETTNAKKDKVTRKATRPATSTDPLDILLTDDTKE